MSLYDEDFVAWSKQQAEALRAGGRAGSNQTLDWENLAEEVEGLGKSERRELKSQIRRIIEHLLKLQYSNAIDPRRGWKRTIVDARNEAAGVLEDSPSLKAEIAAAIAAELARAVRNALFDLKEYGEDAVSANLIRAATFTPEQVLGDWFPPEPQG
ncbi:MAG TPA: DUF29 domain-containing protein [Stellaceae bacterium]|nr:DUF29 domain-containing protein [Stellaceae bacterium]